VLQFSDIFQQELLAIPASVFNFCL